MTIIFDHYYGGTGTRGVTGSVPGGFTGRGGRAAVSTVNRPMSTSERMHLQQLHDWLYRRRMTCTNLFHAMDDDEDGLVRFTDALRVLGRYVKSVFIVHVGGTRCVPSSTGNNMNIQARITLTVECIRTCIFLFLLYV